jgi:glyoxylase-like metal-dependent hydrolase (beta-lactamase superfamily II)
MTTPLTCKLLVASAAVLALPRAASSQPASASQRAFAPARKVLDAAIAAHGGLDALRAIKSVQRAGGGTAYNQGQSLRPGTPYTQRAVAVTSVLDLARGRSATEVVTTPAGGIATPSRSVLRGDDGFTFAPLTKVSSPMSPAGVAAARTALRRDPATLLLTADARAETLRELGTAVFERRPHRVITFADSDGAQLALYVDAQTQRLAKLETLADNPVLGDTVTEVVFSDYQAVSGVQLPARVVTRIAGELVQDLRFTEIKVNVSPADALFEPPAGAISAPLVPGAASVVPTKLADGVWFIAGSSHNSLAVELADSLVLIEAPQSDERSRAVIAKLAELAPAKPIKLVVATHYHYDHSGGLRTHIAAGATIVTTPGNRDFVTKQLVGTPHVIKPDTLSRKPAAPVIDVVTGKKGFGSGDRAIELYEVGPSPHVDEMLVAYLPKHKILFVADLFSIPAAGPIAPGTPANRALADKLKTLGLDIQTIAPGHGRIGTMLDLQKALATPVPN